MQKIKAVLWDNDGVLVDTEKLYYQANLEILLNLNVDFDPETYRKYFLVQGYGMINLLGNLGYKDTEIEKIRERRNKLYSKLLQSEDHSLPGVIETLKALSSKYKMGIVTGSRKDHFDIIHNNTKVLKYMEFAVTQDDYKNSKPHPDPYLEGLKRMGVDATECLAVEDTERGLISAKSAALDCWVIPNNQSINSDFSKADRILNSITEIMNFL